MKSAWILYDVVSFIDGSYSYSYTGLDIFCVWIISAYHSKHCSGRYQDIREDQVDQELTGGAQATKTYKRWGSSGKKQRWQLLTNTDGVGRSECGPMCLVGWGSLIQLDTVFIQYSCWFHIGPRVLRFCNSWHSCWTKGHEWETWEIQELVVRTEEISFTRRHSDGYYSFTQSA